MTPKLIFDDKERIAAWVADRIDYCSPWGGYYAMGIMRGDEVMAGVVVQRWTQTNAVCHWAISKPTRLLHQLFDHVGVYAFRQMGLRRLTGFMDASNTKAVKLSSHIGFVTESVLQDAADDGGDMLVRVLRLDTCYRSVPNGQ